MELERTSPSMGAPVFVTVSRRRLQGNSAEQENAQHPQAGSQGCSAQHLQLATGAEQHVQGVQEWQALHACKQEIRGRSTLPLEKLPDLQQGRELAGGGHCGSTPSVLRLLQESGVKGRKEIATFFYSPPQRVQFIKMGTN